MNWLSRLDEIVSNLLPEEDRKDAKLRRSGLTANTITIDPLLDMDLNYGMEEHLEEVDYNDDDGTFLDDSMEVVQNQRHRANSVFQLQSMPMQQGLSLDQTGDQPGAIMPQALDSPAPSHLLEINNQIQRFTDKRLVPIETESSMLPPQGSCIVLPSGSLTTIHPEEEESLLLKGKAGNKFELHRPPNESISITLQNGASIASSPLHHQVHDEVLRAYHQLPKEVADDAPSSSCKTSVVNPLVFHLDQTSPSLGDSFDRSITSPFGTMLSPSLTDVPPAVALLHDDGLPTTSTETASQSAMSAFATPFAVEDLQRHSQDLLVTETPYFRTPDMLHSPPIHPTTPISFKPLGDSLSLKEMSSPHRQSPLPTLSDHSPPLPLRNVDVSREHDITGDLEVTFPLPDWNTLENKLVFHPSMNCFGVVHVRALRAQNLPCPVGSTVQLAVSLSPWNGKVRGEPTVAFEHPINGVSTKWDILNEATGCSMVHQWSSSDTPMPWIKIELLFKPLQILEFTMCFLDLTCEPLMVQPGMWKKQWCRATLSTESPSSSPHPVEGSLVAEHSPLILVEAAFFPASQDDNNQIEQEDELSSTPENTTCGERSVRLDDGSSLRSIYQLKASTKVHHLNLRSFWKPANCAVCKRSLIGWKKGFRCESCTIDCCADCQLQIDLQIPCGSLVAKVAVEKSLQHKLTLENILNTIAPLEKDYVKSMALDLHHRRKPALSQLAEPIEPTLGQRSRVDTRRVGEFRVKIHQAILFQTPCPMDTDPSTVFTAAEGNESTARVSLRQGDYFVRVSGIGSDGTTDRTRTIQNSGGRPRFSDSPELVFDLPHYGMEYRVDVVDAYSNKSVGGIVVTAQTMLQSQRDRCIETNGIDAFIPRIRKRNAICRQMGHRMELRTGFPKDGFGSDYFLSYKARHARRLDQNLGAVSGWIMVDMAIVEDFDSLFGQSPIKCQSRPPNKFDIEILQNQMARLGLLVEDIKTSFQAYWFLVSWKNPLLTGFSFVVLVKLCCTYDIEYIGSLPILFLLLDMLYLAGGRKFGLLKQRFIRRERESRSNVEQECCIDTSLHRPMGKIQVSVRKGRHLRSRDLGLPGSVGCHVLWDPHRYCENEDAAKRLSSSDKVFISYHNIAETNYMFTPNPDWDTIKESHECKRLNHMLSPESAVMIGSEIHCIDDWNQVYAEYPLLQPIQNRSTETTGVSPTGISLAPWTNIPGAIVFQIKFGDVINMIPGFEDTLGEVAIPLSKIIEKREYRGWFQVVGVGSTHFLRCDEEDETDLPRIYLHVKWKEPQNHEDRIPDSDREASIVVAEEMVRAAIQNSRTKGDIIKNSIGAMNSVRGLGESVQSIQNTLGNFVDILERIRNLFNFTDPGMSSFVFIVLTLLYLILSFIPLRVVILGIVVGQYGTTFAARFGLSTASSIVQNQTRQRKTTVDDNRRPMPWITWFANMFESLPTDDDLRKAYFWECARLSHFESLKRVNDRRVSRLEQLWNAKWYSEVKLRVANARKAALPSTDWTWESRFVVVHGRRLLIWKSVIDFDFGEPAVDRVVLSGHAGLAGLSPIEMRELSADEVTRVVNIFGRGIHGQLKMMLLVPSETAKESLEETVLSAAIKDD